MKNKVLLTTILGLTVAAGSAWAQAVTSGFQFDVRATLPKATGFVCDLSSVNVADGVWTSAGSGGGGVMDFGTLQYNSEFKIWVPASYFVCDITPSGGVGIPDVKFEYTEGPAGDVGNPNAQYGYNGGKGLGHKGTITVAGASVDGETSFGSAALKDAATVSLQESQLGPAGLWPRFYVGLSSGEGAGEPFTNIDHYGTYTGTLKVTATMP